jgi:hypothetical protein
MHLLPASLICLKFFVNLFIMGWRECDYILTMFGRAVKKALLEKL